ncbi:hypothetical protein [Eoetvoesiella caeni]
MFSRLLKKLGYVRQEPGLVVLTSNDVEVISEALSMYKNRLPNQNWGYFTEATKAAQDKVAQIQPDLKSRFVSF